MAAGADAVALNVASIPGEDLEKTLRQLADRIGHYK
jgi:hypothetical protein